MKIIRKRKKEKRDCIFMGLSHIKANEFRGFNWHQAQPLLDGIAQFYFQQANQSEFYCFSCKQLADQNDVLLVYELPTTS